LLPIPSFARSVELPLKTFKGYHVNPNAPLIYRIDAGSGIQVEQSNREMRVEKPELPINIPFKTTAEVQSTDVKVSVSFYYCREDNQGACFIDAVIWKLPVKIDKDSESTEILLDYQVKLP